MLCNYNCYTQGLGVIGIMKEANFNFLYSSPLSLIAPSTMSLLVSKERKKEDNGEINGNP